MQLMVQKLLQCLIRIDQPQARTSVNRLIGSYVDMLKAVGSVSVQVRPPLAKEQTALAACANGRGPVQAYIKYISAEQLPCVHSKPHRLPCACTPLAASCASSAVTVPPHKRCLRMQALCCLLSLSGEDGQVAAPPSKQHWQETLVRRIMGHDQAPACRAGQDLGILYPFVCDSQRDAQLFTHCCLRSQTPTAPDSACSK